MAPRARKDVTVTPETGHVAVAEIKLRVRGDLRQKLGDAAERHGVPLNAEIVRRLVDSFQVDAKLRELEIEREWLRTTHREFSEREAKYLERERLLTDHLLKLTAGLALQSQGERK
jgi:hypothetical protein